MESEKLCRIEMFFDGYFFYKVNQHYAKYKHRAINISGLQNYIKYEVASKMNCDIEQCRLNARYFIGKPEASYEGMQKLEYDFTVGGVKAVYLPMRVNAAGTIKEKGIDVMLALEAYKNKDNMDVFVLFSGDGDYVPLVKELQENNIKVYCVYSDFDYVDYSGEQQKTRASQFLLETVNDHFDLELIANARVHRSDYTKNVFENGVTIPGFSAQNTFQNQNAFQTAPLNNVQAGRPDFTGREDVFGGHPFIAPPPLSPLYTSEEAFLDAEHESVIHSVRSTDGWIYSEEHNNYYFYRDDLVEGDFDRLERGSPVRFYLEKNDYTNSRGAYTPYRVKPRTLRTAGA